MPVAIPNGGAEKVHEARADRPAGVEVWTSAGVDALFRRDTSVKRSGKASFYIRNHGTKSEGSAGSAVYIFNGQAVYGLDYTATAWVKTKDAKHALLDARAQDGSGTWLDLNVKSGTISGTNDWTMVTCTWSPPAGAAKFVLYLNLRRGGEAWFDDVQVHDSFNVTRQLAALQEKVNAAAKAMRELSAWNAPFGAELAAKAKAELAPIHREANEYVKQLRDRNVEPAVRAQWAQQMAKLSSSQLLAQRLAGIGRAIRGSDRGGGEYIAGWADSMEHVFLRNCPAPMRVGEAGRILAVRGEVEAIQLVILPVRGDLQKVRVSAAPLRSDGGKTIAADRIAVHPIGFAKTSISPAHNYVPIEHDYRGWWPDPVLENFAFDVTQGDTQPVWISVDVPLDQAPGIYRGLVRIEPSGAAPIDLPIEVEVADVELPQSNPWAFRNLMSWWSTPPEEFFKDKWTPELEAKYFDFLLDRRINVLSIYGNEAYENEQNIKKFAARGQNVFMLDWYSRDRHVIDDVENQIRDRLNRFLPMMVKNGWLDRTYVYGWDEIGDPAVWPELHREFRFACEVLAADYPGVRMMSAGTDRTYGTDSSLKGLTNISFCPHMKYDVDQARRAQAAGNHVWWYDTEWPIDNHLIRSRLIPWQTYKLKADGFLIWCINRWRKNDKPIGKQILTDWNPALDNVTPHSSAMYIYPGEDGPISSLRLENFRDGIEDYELMVEAARRGIAFEIADDVTSDLTTYTTDPRKLRAQREQLIRALVR